MKNRKCFFWVFSSSAYTYGRIMILMICSLFWGLYNNNKDPAFLVFSLIVTLTLGIAFLYISPLLIVSKRGVRLLGFPYHWVLMEWESIRMVGTWTQRVGQNDNLIKFIFFSTTDSPKREGRLYYSAPKMTSGFVYATASKKLETLYKQYWKIAETKGNIGVNRDGSL